VVTKLILRSCCKSYKILRIPSLYQISIRQIAGYPVKVIWPQTRRKLGIHSRFYYDKQIKRKWAEYLSQSFTLVRIKKMIPGWKSVTSSHCSISLLLGVQTRMTRVRTTEESESTLHHLRQTYNVFQLSFSALPILFQN
jgi:hypothetical protein